MNIAVIGAGNSGLAMAAHLSADGHSVTLWNRSRENIQKLMYTRKVRCTGVLEGEYELTRVTNDIELALSDADLVLITTPASAHRELAKLMAAKLMKPCPIILNPGRTFGAIEFANVLRAQSARVEPLVAETQTIIYTCRKTGQESVNIIAIKQGVLISAVDPDQNHTLIGLLPECIRKHFSPASSIIETSIGNVGMILHCAPLLLNSGWTESSTNSYKYYYDGISPSIGMLIERIDAERVAVGERLGIRVETTAEWLRRTYNVRGDSLFECVQNNAAYKTIDAPTSLQHRYILEDVPYGLVPLEALGLALGLSMKHTTLIVDLANALLAQDFRQTGRRLDNTFPDGNWMTVLMERSRC